jgi:hypothetical protein
MQSFAMEFHGEAARAVGPDVARGGGKSTPWL